MQRTYLAIDLKSFYASAECVKRGLDPMDTNLVVADISRTEKTICLAVSPPLKKRGVSGRPRLYEVIQKVKGLNEIRLKEFSLEKFSSESYSDKVINENTDIGITYLVAPPRMALYRELSKKINKIYEKYVSPMDIHVYSVDEVFMDITWYIKSPLDAYKFTLPILKDVLKQTGITATAGVGTNIYLAKIAMDIVAKRKKPNKDGIIFAGLDEISYRKKLWTYEPLTDFWSIGRGYSEKLAKYHIYTMGDIAKCSMGSKSDYYNKDLLYKLFGVNAKLLIDHAWGYESCTIEEIKTYTKKSESISNSQVLSRAYKKSEARIILKEMVDLLCMELLSKKLTTNTVAINVSFDKSNMSDEEVMKNYKGELKIDRYGRLVPKSFSKIHTMDKRTDSISVILENILKLYDEGVDERLSIRKIGISFDRICKQEILEQNAVTQMTFDSFIQERKIKTQEEKIRERDDKLQKTMLEIRNKHGKNAVFKGLSLYKEATGIERNKLIGGHNAWKW